MTASVPTSKNWRLLSPMPDHVRHELRAYHPVMAQALYNRGLSSRADAYAFLNGGDGALHSPHMLHGMPQAVARIRNAIKRGESIAIYGDFDADGVTSTALLMQVFTALGAQVQPYIPNRVDEGYGLNMGALKQLADQGVKLVITVDCGIRSIAEVEYGNSLGLDMIVTDHHSVGEQLPPALAVINPKIDARLRQDEGQKRTYPEDMLAGVGVAYKLAEMLLRVIETQDRRSVNFDLEDLLDLVALGTVADLAPLNRPENRELVRRGLKVLNRGKRLGVYELYQVAGIDLEKTQINTTTIAFMLGPRINAAGRLDSAMIAHDLLLSNNGSVASELAQQLQDLNLRRQELTLEAVGVARERAFSGADGDLPLIFDAGTEFPHGIVGLVAGRLCEEFYRPAIVVGTDKDQQEWRGSCRSIPEFDITQALDRCADLLIRHGGHAQAAGFTVSAENLPILRERLMAMAREALGQRDLRPVLNIDAEVPLDQLTTDLADALSQLEPCGANNELPVFVTRGLRVVDHRCVGQEGKHLKLRLSDRFMTIDAIAFRQGEWDKHLPACVDVAYHLEINEWNGARRLQLNVQDIHPSDPSL
ncbi:MAG: single-stranded-DNA-specific exonuclease RecJ [Chloroflexi bacterium]|nr:single-stranded-DNA-specific exonuclease RecJ [Chloroflexota bacterium]